jgi:hypothetical protein
MAVSYSETALIQVYQAFLAQAEHQPAGATAKPGKMLQPLVAGWNKAQLALFLPCFNPNTFFFFA